MGVKNRGLAESISAQPAKLSPPCDAAVTQLRARFGAAESVNGLTTSHSATSFFLLMRNQCHRGRIFSCVDELKRCYGDEG